MYVMWILLSLFSYCVGGLDLTTALKNGTYSNNKSKFLFVSIVDPLTFSSVTLHKVLVFLY
jgi:hypothetical protein